MQPQRLVGLVLIAGGIVLLVIGIQATDSFASQFHKFFTGSPSDRAIWMIIGGAVAIAVGAGSSLYPGRRARV